MIQQKISQLDYIVAIYYENDTSIIQVSLANSPTSSPTIQPDQPML